jgi:hypothetical protein
MGRPPFARDQGPKGGRYRPGPAAIAETAASSAATDGRAPRFNGRSVYFAFALFSDRTV